MGLERATPRGEGHLVVCPVVSDKRTCCKVVGAVANILVTISTELALNGVAKAAMETDTAKADFAEGVASTITGVDKSDIKSIVVTEMYTRRCTPETQLQFQTQGVALRITGFIAKPVELL